MAENIKFVSHGEPSPSLKEAQAFIGGTVELRWLPDGRQILFNEDGLRLKLPTNYAASRLFGRPIVGNVIILGGDAKWS